MAKKSLEDRIMDWFFSKVNAAMSHVIKPDMKVENVGCLTQDEIRALKQKYGIKGVILDIDETVRHDMGEIPDVNKEWIDMIKQELKVIVVSNGIDKKVERYLELPNVVSVQYADVLKYGKAVFWMGHYPTITANYDDDKPWAKHVVCLFGHTHQEQPFYNDNPYMYNVGMDAHNCTPITIDEIVADIRKKKEELNNEQMANRAHGIE